MKTVLRLLAVATMVLGVTVVSGSAASAAAPANDDPGGATVITSLPASFQQDTTEATTSSLETDINNAFCGAPELAQGVWFSYTATEDTAVSADASGSDYPVGIFMATGSPDSVGTLNPWSCAPITGFAQVAAGETVYILAFGDGTGSANSGQLVLNVEVAPPPPDIQVTVDPIGYVDKAGNVTLTGTVACEGGGDVVFYEVYGTLEQKVGRFKIRGFYDTIGDIACDGTTVPFTALAIGDNGTFAGGKSANVTIAFACNNFFCSEDYLESTIQLRKGVPRKM